MKWWCRLWCGLWASACASEPTLEEVFATPVQAAEHCTAIPRYERLPVRIEIDPQLGARNRQALLEALDAWQQLAAADLFAREVRTGHQPCAIRVSERPMHGETRGWTDLSSHCEASIVLGDDNSPALAGLTAAHELGHALGMLHEADETSLMHDRLDSVERVSAESRCMISVLVERAED